MKFKITITKEVIDKSLMCGREKVWNTAQNCAFAVAYNELAPMCAYLPRFEFIDKGFKKIAECEATHEQRMFIFEFDQMTHNPYSRYDLVGQSFDVEIPDEVIEYWYGDASKAAQKIIDNPIMQAI